MTAQNPARPPTSSSAGRQRIRVLAAARPELLRPGDTRAATPGELVRCASLCSSAPGSDRCGCHKCFVDLVTSLATTVAELVERDVIPAAFVAKYRAPIIKAFGITPATVEDVLRCLPPPPQDWPVGTSIELDVNWLVLRELPTSPPTEPS